MDYVDVDIDIPVDDNHENLVHNDEPKSHKTAND
jgi:hypothetical protein